MARRLESHLAALGVPSDVKTYPHAGHSFFSKVEGWQGWLARMPSPMAVGYDEDAAEDGWQRMLAFFDEHVRG
jgi:carboxymethylenebutenolidase